MGTKILYFEGAGMPEAERSKATIGNCRVRTTFHTDFGDPIYLEITSYEVKSKFGKKYWGNVDSCFYITDDQPNDDENQHRVWMYEREVDYELDRMPCSKFKYNERDILWFVNSLGCSFDRIQVLPNLAGYRVHKDNYDRKTSRTAWYNYGDQFHYDPDLTAKRIAIHDAVYAMEKRERKEDRANRTNRFVHSPSGNDYPNLSLWVDQDDTNILHLLRHFNGYNKHWLIRTDVSGSVQECVERMVESRLGLYGC